MIDELEKQVARSGLTIHWTHIVGNYAGAYDDQRKVIYLDALLDTRPRHYASTLAHEYAHYLLGHTGHGRARQERYADQLASLVLIDDELFRRACSMYGGDASQIAQELGTTVHLVETYRDIDPNVQRKYSAIIDSLR